MSGPDLIADATSGKAKKRNRGLPRCYRMRIAQDGTWFHDGTSIKRIALVKLFASVLVHKPDGSYWLETPFEHGRIEVDDVPFLAVEVIHATGMDSLGHGDILWFRTNLDEIIECGPKHPLRVATDPVTLEPRPYILVRERLEARLSRAVFHEVAELALEGEIDGERVYGVWSNGRFFRLGPVEPEC